MFSMTNIGFSYLRTGRLEATRSRDLPSPSPSRHTTVEPDGDYTGSVHYDMTILLWTLRIYVVTQQRQLHNRFPNCQRKSYLTGTQKRSSQLPGAFLSYQIVLRKVKVLANDNAELWSYILGGVPQGIKQGHVLFDLMINDGIS